MTVFEPGLLPQAEKERLVRDLLDEFGLRVHSHSAHRQELIVPCVLGEHRNQESEPTAAVNYEKLTFKCLGCQRSGGLLWFIAAHRGGSSGDARDWLGKETGTDGHVQELPALLRYFDALYTKREAKPPIQRYSTKILEPWDLLHPWVTDPVDHDAQGRSVGGRGIPEENADRFRVGYAERFNMGFTKDDAGKITPLPTSERIVIPHFWQGDLVGWQTRRLGADGTPKYKSSTDFPKDETLFNYDPAQEALVVESPFSVLRHDHVVHTEATFGANVTETQIRLLSRHPRLVFWMDNDQAGWTACQGLWEHRGRRSKQTKVGVLEACARLTDVWVVNNPFDADPADMSEDDVQRLHGEAVPWVVWEPPKTLLCYRCGCQTHDGGCP